MFVRFSTWLAHRIHMQFDFFFLNSIIYLSQKRKKKKQNYLIWNKRLGRRVRELCDQGSLVHPQETCTRCQQPHLLLSSPGSP